MTSGIINPLLKRRPRGGVSRIERDPAVLAFINSLDRYYSIKELRELIAERFGSERTPSKSGLGRFLKKIFTDGGDL